MVFGSLFTLEASTERQHNGLGAYINELHHIGFDEDEIEDMLKEGSFNWND